jgi:glucose-6-phosphate 1-dehydrogenase
VCFSLVAVVSVTNKNIDIFSQSWKSWFTMEIWKLVVLGISGNLAKEKILPAISQFAIKNEDRVQIDLIGYSRSSPDINEIKKILGINDASSQIPGIRSVKLVRGEYDDYKFFDELYASLAENERAVIYMAVPPLVFLDFIKDSCPYHTDNIDILLEKPFGENLNQVSRIFDTINRCKLHERVRFCDHYLFKTETNLDKSELINLKFLNNLQLNKVTIKTLEKVGVDDRIGYFNKIGSFLDMLTHLFSLLRLSLEHFKTSLSDSSAEKIELESLVLGQYESYKHQPEVATSETETYFNLKLKLIDLKVELESGKELGQKITEIVCEFENQTTLKWQIYPEKKLEIISSEVNFSLSLDKNSNLDHTNLFEQLLDNNYENFLNQAEVLNIWKVINLVLNFKETNKIYPQIYPNGKYPVQFLK